MLFHLFGHFRNQNNPSASQQHRKTVRPSGVQPRLECLEDRLAPAAFTVSTTLDDGSLGSLRNAVNQSNTTPGPNTIDIKISTTGSGGGPATIVLGSPLVLTNQVSILMDALGAPTDITGSGGTSIGLVFDQTTTTTSSGSSIIGQGNGASAKASLSFVNFGTAIQIKTNSNTISGIRVGLDDTGNAFANNVGIDVLGQSNTIGGVGGLAAASKVTNIISGNSLFGISMDLLGSRNNLVEGNFVGTDASGTSAKPNGMTPGGGDGVAVYNGAQFNTVGGAASTSGNLLSGNIRFGVSVFATGTQQNVVQNNSVGLNLAGTATLPNGMNLQGDGIAVFAGATNNLIGGQSLGNTVSGNGRFGISVFGTGTSNNLVQGNVVGLNSAGTLKLANQLDGIDIFFSAANNTIGGVMSSQGNTISGNGRFGSFLFNGATTNSLLNNFIGTNPGGAVAQGNNFDGVAITASSGNVVGGIDTLAGTTLNRTTGNVISGNSRFGVYLFDAGGGGGNNNQVQGNFIGVDGSGTTALPNAVDGVFVSGASANTIGSSTAGAGNVISGNGLFGVRFTGKTSGNAVLGNYIGTDNDGTGMVGNTFDGVAVFGSTGNTIGNGNVISGNGRFGVWLNSGASNNIVSGSFIGTDVTGLLPLGNGFDGVQIGSGSTANLIGGASPLSRNVIGGNKREGILIRDKGTTGNNIQGNLIGVGSDGMTKVGNGTAVTGGMGVAIVNAAANNNIGGTAAGAGNIIANNTQAGVLVGVEPNIPDFGANPGGPGNIISQNSIFNNDGPIATATVYGIALGTPTQDPTTDPTSNTQIRPNLLSFVRTGAQVQVTYSFIGSPSTSYRIEFFSSDIGGVVTNGKSNGQIFLTSVNITTDATGMGMVTPVTLTVPVGQSLSATATDLSATNSKGTSMFSTYLVV